MDQAPWSSWVYLQPDQEPTLSSPDAEAPSQLLPCQDRQAVSCQESPDELVHQEGILDMHSDRDLIHIEQRNQPKVAVKVNPNKMTKPHHTGQLMFNVSLHGYT